MGRTIPSWRMVLEEELKRWKRFRDALRIDERPVFDDLMDECRRRASETGAAVLPTKAEGMFLSLLFSHHKSLKELRDKIEQINRFLEESKRSR
jgi:hypothetical protein